MINRQKINFLASGIALAVILISGWVIPSPLLDWLNIVPVMGTLYLVAFFLILPGLLDFKQRNVLRIRFFLSLWFRLLVVIALLVTSIEFSLRMKSYHRTV